jgi:hypothetical protein
MMNDIKGQSSIYVGVPVGQVYEYLLDFGRHPEWARNLQKVTKVAGPGKAGVGVGTVFRTQEGPPPVRWHQKVRMMGYFMAGLVSGAKGYSEARITALEPDKRIAWEAGIPKGEGYFNFAEWEFVLNGEGDGTWLTQRFHYRPQHRLAAGMMGTAGVAGIERACAVSLGRLKGVLEGATRLPGNELPV